MNIRIVFIDTGYHFNEIMSYAEKLSSKIEIIVNNKASINYAVDMDKCCTERKAETLKEYLNNIKVECLVVPFRDDDKLNGIENSYLKGIDNIEIIRPLADLTERDIWTRIKEQNLTFSTIYKRGYKF